VNKKFVGEPGITNFLISTQQGEPVEEIRNE
jgi:hypothetical protein